MCLLKARGICNTHFCINVGMIAVRGWTKCSLVYKIFRTISDYNV